MQDHWPCVDAIELPRAERYFGKYLTVERSLEPRPWIAHRRLGLVVKQIWCKREAIAELQTSAKIGFG